MSRQRLRATLLLAGIVPAVLAFVVLMKVAVMMGNDRAGRSDFHADDFTAAAERFDANKAWNWFEPWIAPFDHGAAVHADGDYLAAIDLYDEALRTVPEVEECTVRINQALAHEALGDIEAGRQPPSGDLAIEHWQAGIAALAAGNCPTEAGRGERQTEEAAEVDRRLREKIQQEQQRQEQEQEQEGDGQTPQEEQLDERNSEGREERRDLEEGGGAQAEEERRNADEGEGQSGHGSEEEGGEGGGPEPRW